MTKINWKNNNHQGRFVARSLKRLEADFKVCNSSEERRAALRDYVYIWDIMARVGKSVELEALKADVEELKNLAGLDRVAKLMV